MSGVAPAASRPRPSRSCQRCARRKVKCDQVRPRCSRCVHGDLECRYENGNRYGNQQLTFIDETSAVAADYASLHGKVRRLDGMLRDIGSGSYKQEDSTGSSATPQEQDIGHLYLGSQSDSRYVSPDFFALISQEVAGINSLLQQQYRSNLELHASLFEPENTDLDACGDQDLRSSSWTNGSNSGTIALTAQLCGDMFPPPPEWTSEDRTTRYAARLTSPGELLDGLPSGEQCEALVWIYMEGYHTISPLFHGPSFLQDVRRYTEGNFPSNPNLDLHFLALFTAVLFAGCAISSRKRLGEIFPGQTREDLSSKFYQGAVRAIRLTNFPQSPSLNTLASFIITDTIYLREEQPLTCCSFVGLATRVAQMLGLHKDPASFPDLSAVDIQVRRQLWWSLVAIDVQVALAAGLPPIIDCTTCQVQELSELPEDLPHPGMPSKDHQKSILGVIVRGKVEFYRKASRILNVIHSNRFSREDLDHVLSLIHVIKSDLDARIQEIAEMEATLASPAEMMNGHDDMSMLRQSQSNPVLAQFGKAALALLSAKPYAIIQGPVRRQKLESYLNEKDPQAIAGCRKYLHGFLKITQRPEFQPWHWRWPGQHQPLHSIMALIIDLSTCSDDTLARETRKLVDLAIYMCGPQENNGIQSTEDGHYDSRPLSMAGSKAWEFIRETRSKVWIKAGLDAVVLTCPERAEDIHFDGEGGLMESTMDFTPMVEVPMDLMGGWHGLDEDWLNADVDDNFTFDPSLFFTGESM
ncbi:fungal-specific transcription factor domain-containing protein [Leptodontidium sp. 2 PMI_412]|nr:fungal-specific transcription factor domain-containing protein [Leptodontidium sp. 2 PMI_412]